MWQCRFLLIFNLENVHCRGRQSVVLLIFFNVFNVFLTTVFQLLDKLLLPTLALTPYSVGTDFSRQNLTSVDVRFWRLKSIPALYEYKYLYWP